MRMVGPRFEKVNIKVIGEVGCTKQRFVGRSYWSETYISQMDYEKTEVGSLQSA